MATIKSTWVSTFFGTATVTWTPITENDTGDGAAVSHYPDKTVQILGTFGGGTVRIEGSNDGGTTYAALHDPQGNTLDLTAAGIKLIAENPNLIRPRATAGASMSVTIAIEGAPS